MFVMLVYDRLETMISLYLRLKVENVLSMKITRFTKGHYYGTNFHVMYMNLKIDGYLRLI